MIKSKSDFLNFMELDKVALGIKHAHPRLFNDEIWRFQRLLRRTEYITNCKDGILWGIYLKYLRLKLHYFSIMLGFSIPLNTCGPGLAITHYGMVIINSGAKIGANCRIHGGVNIGTGAGHTNLAPTIEDNVYIGPGAKLFGDIKIAEGICIGANAVVSRSFEESNITIGGVPAKKISDKGSAGLLNVSKEFYAAFTFSNHS